MRRDTGRWRRRLLQREGMRDEIDSDRRDLGQEPYFRRGDKNRLGRTEEGRWQLS